jgi:hypothetical protein
MAYSNSLWHDSQLLIEHDGLVKGLLLQFCKLSDLPNQKGSFKITTACALNQPTNQIVEIHHVHLTGAFSRRNNILTCMLLIL